MTDQKDLERSIPNWTVMVLLGSKKRVRHLTVWGPTGPASPLCRTRGDFPWYGGIAEFRGVPICTRCRGELDLMVSAVRNADVSDG